MAKRQFYENKVMQVSDLIPYINNARTHSDQQIAQVAASIKEFGFTNPVLIDTENGIIAGHGRVLAALKLGLEQVPCIVLDGLTEAQRKAYVIADNQLALNSGWDDEKLRLELEHLESLDFNMDLLGFPTFDDWETDIEPPEYEESEAEFFTLKIKGDPEIEDEVRQEVANLIKKFAGVELG
jgi:hypothetical protein